MPLVSIRFVRALIVFLPLLFATPVCADPYLEQEADQNTDDGQTPPDEGGNGSGNETGSASNAAGATQPATQSQGWPRQMTTGDGTVIYLYAPQVESWDQKKLQARAAV